MRVLRRLALLLLALLAACAQPPVRDAVTIDFDENDDQVLVTAETSFDATPRTDAALARANEAREAALHGIDPWAVRFARMKADRERTILDRNQGTLDRVTHSIRIPARDLQGVFSDTNITVHVLRGEGWSELSFYPGSSIRATREQNEHFTQALDTWSAAVARYYTAIHYLYLYIDDNPPRAEHLFAAILGETSEDGIEPVVLEEEQPLVDEVLRTMDDIAARMDEDDGTAATFAEEADLIFNPFPARIVVKVPGEVLGTQGFGEDLTIEPIDLFATVSALQGRWISPDPLAALLRDETPKAADLAIQPRRSAVNLRPSDIAEAIRAELERPKTYVVRWRD